MDSENPTLKWSLAAVGVVVVCFCLGYFVFGTKGSAEPDVPTVATPSPEPSPAGLQITAVSSQGLQVEDITAEKEAERKRKEEAARAKEEARLKAAEAGTVEANPAPEEADEDGKKTMGSEGDGEATSEGEKMKSEDEKTKPEDEKTKPEGEKTKSEGEKTKPEDEKTKPEGEKTKSEDDKTKPDGEKETASKGLFRVRVGGAKTSRDDADRLVAELRGRGYTPTIIADQRKGKTVFHVQAGAFSDSDGAERRKKELENNGYDARIN